MKIILILLLIILIGCSDQSPTRDLEITEPAITGIDGAEIQEDEDGFYVEIGVRDTNIKLANETR